MKTLSQATQADDSLRARAKFVVDLYNSSEVNGVSWGSHAEEAIAALEAALNPESTSTRPTQRERIEFLLTGLRIALPRESLSGMTDEFYRVVTEAQNEPPHGIADGSVDVEYWSMAREVARALSTLNNYLHVHRA